MVFESCISPSYILDGPKAKLTMKFITNIYLHCIFTHVQPAYTDDDSVSAPIQYIDVRFGHAKYESGCSGTGAGKEFCRQHSKMS